MDFEVFSPYNPIVKQTLRRRKEIPKKEELPFAKTKNL